MLAIANARGVPGTVAVLVRMRDGRRGLLSCFHVLFGRGAGEGDTVWALVDSPRGARRVALGKTVRGMLGRVTHEGRVVFVDCALAVLADALDLPEVVTGDLGSIAGARAATPRVGAAVTKRGPVTGETRGTVVETDHFDSPFVEGRAYEAPAQLRIRPDGDDDECFSGAGDSGAAVIDEDGGVVGLLWGSNAAGEGIACPLRPVLDHLDVELEEGW